jgi:putative ABC transport system permease protein
LVEALRQPYTVAIDETAVKSLGVKLGDKALYNGRTVTVVGILRGYPNMMQQTVVMSRDTLRMVGQADTGPRVGPLMVKIRNPADAERVVADLNAAGGGQWKAWTRDELAAANQGAMFDEGPLIIILGGVTFVGIVIGVAITWQTLRGAIMANIKEFASLRALGVGMGSLRWIVVELSFWVGVVGVAAAVLLTWLVALFAASQGVLIALQPDAIMMVGGGLIAIAMVSGMLSLGVLKNSQPADLLR